MKSRIKKTLLSQISLNIVPHGIKIPPITIRFPLWTIALVFVFSAVFIFAFLKMSSVYADYAITKIDNHIMKERLRYISARAKEGIIYLEMARKTETQLKKVIGEKDFTRSDTFLGGPREEDVRDFKQTLKDRASKINSEIINRVYDGIKKESKARLSGYSEITWYITNNNNLSKAIPKDWPVKGNITSSFGYRMHPISFSYEYHSGIDISQEPGTPILATADGTVRYAGWQQGYGMSVLVDHGFGYSTVYGHMSEIAVKEGEEIRRGGQIGKVGSTGTSTGPHLHYEIWESGRPTNPIKYMNNYNEHKMAKAFLFEKIFGK